MSSPLAIAGVLPASRLAQRPAPATVTSGIAELDALTGGLPRGALSEICGPPSSGRSSVLLALLSAMTRRQEACALVDASDSFDPHSAAAAGVELRRLLWVRCSSPRRHGGTENRMIGRSGDRVIENHGQWSLAGGKPKSQITTDRKSQMNRLEQALKATDLLLQGGGFGLVAVDLGDVAAETAARVPLTSWFRFRRAVENTPAVLLVIEREPHAKSCASLVVKLSAVSSQLSASRQKGNQQSAISIQRDDMALPAHACILRGLNIRAELLRDRDTGKKPVRSAAAEWESKTAWAG